MIENYSYVKRMTMSVNTVHVRFSLIYLLLIISSFYVFAEDELKVVRTSTNSFDIQLSNSDDVSGVQFCVHSTHGIILETVKPGSSIANSSWIVGSYSANDSTVNILVLNTHERSFPHGSETLASIIFRMVDPSQMDSITLSNVMVVDSSGDSLGVIITNLVWHGKTQSQNNSEESKPFNLYQNYPNPFNPATMVHYRLNTPAVVRLSIYDITGREVVRLVDEYQNTGDYHLTWDSHSKNDKKLSSGVYIAQLHVGRNRFSQKMLLTK
jgi:hypothetical protein